MFFADKLDIIRAATADTPSRQYHNEQQQQTQRAVLRRSFVNCHRLIAYVRSLVMPSPH